MNSSSSGGKLERFFTGKGFYIVLFLCAAVIGVSAWMMAAGNETMQSFEQTNERSPIGRTETVIVPSVMPDASPVMDLEELLPETEAEEAVTAETEPQVVEVMAEEAVEEVQDTGYLWPVSGDISRAYHIDQLRYDATMSDWRTHDGIDIRAALGSEVYASRAGTVESVVKDDLYGTVLTLDHGDGTQSVYANLSDSTAVGEGEFVQTGALLGSVGATAICESAQDAHLHFAMRVDGRSADPLSYLNG